MSLYSRRKFVQGAAAAAAVATSCKPAPAKPPNVLYVFSDQQHAQTVSAYGGTPVRTPAIDRLAQEGCRFDNAISTMPVCSPYRGMLMSGRHPMRNGVINNDTPLSDGLPTFGKMYRDAGYQTGYIGKWHLESKRTPFVPKNRRQGFDYWAVLNCSHKHFDSTYYGDDPENPGEHVGYEPFSQVNLAIDFMRNASGAADPFCLAISFGPPHNPYKAPEEYERAFMPESGIPLPANAAERAIVDELLRTDTRPMTPQEKRSRENRRAILDDDDRLRREVLRGYYGACEALDTGFERLLTAMDELGITDDTIIVYTSDHGDMVGSHRMLLKQCPLEESIHVPFLIRYPAAISAGRTTQRLMTPIDVLPTLLSLSGIDYDPSTYDGLDCSDVAFRGATDDRDAVLLSKMLHGGGPWIINGLRPWRGIRTHRHLYAEHEGEPWLLFDNQEDPHQMSNLIADAGRSTLRRELRGRMQELMLDADDTLTEEELMEFRRRQIAAYPG
jgi:arylsulfatase A-like enzyme